MSESAITTSFINSIVTLAIAVDHYVKIKYEDLNGEETERYVKPTNIFFDKAKGWVFSGECQLRKDHRTFRFDGVKSINASKSSGEEYPAGTRVRLSGIYRDDDYIVAQVASLKAALISLNDGNRYKEAVESSLESGVGFSAEGLQTHVGRATFTRIR